MKRIIFLLTAIFMCVTAHAATETINWYMDGNTYATTLCETGSDIILPQTPYKYGYTFNGWIGYTPIEYLESTGTQYIDTGIVGNLNTAYEITSMTYKHDFNKTYILFGSRTSATSNSIISTFAYNTATNSLDVDQDFGNYSITRQVVQNNMINIKVTMYNSKNLRSVYNWNTNTTHTDTKTYTGSLTTPSNLYIGYSRAGTMHASASNFEGRVYECKIWQDDILVRDFIPVLDKDGVPCMYDKVENKFYYNAGTGQFIAGPVIGGD